MIFSVKFNLLIQMLPRHYWGWVGAQFLSWQCSFCSSLSPSAVVQLLDRPNSCCRGVHLQQLVCDPACGLGAVLAAPLWGIFFVGSNSENMNLLGRSAGVSCVPKAPRETGMKQNKKGSPRNHSFVHANRAWHQHGEVSAVEREPSGCSPVTGWIFSLFPTFHCHLLALTEWLLRWPWSKYLWWALFT